MSQAQSSYENLDFERWETSAPEGFFGENAQWSAPLHGDKALRLETAGEEMVSEGYIMTGQIDPQVEYGEDWLPGDQPLVLEGYIRHDIKAGDSATIQVTYWDVDNIPVGYGELWITGKQDEWTKVEVRVPEFIGTPHRIALVFASGTEHIFQRSYGTTTKGSFLEVDDFRFRRMETADEVHTTALKAYPNPVEDVLNIELPEAYENGKIQLFNANGQLVQEAAVSGSNVRIMVGELPKGTYTATFVNAQGDRPLHGLFVKQ